MVGIAGCWWRWFMALSRRSVHCHDPQMTFVFVVDTHQNRFSISDGIHKVFAPLQFCNCTNMSKLNREIDARDDEIRLPIPTMSWAENRNEI